MRFKLNPHRKTQKNLVYLIKDFLIFKKGEVIWANHAASGNTAYYCSSSNSRNVRKKPNSQHLDYFFRCAVPLTFLYWNMGGGIRYKLTTCDVYDAAVSGGKFSGYRFFKDQRERVDLSHYDLNLFLLRKPEFKKSDS